ncbi:Nitrate/nitrite sensor protein NarX [Massilia sp. Bi118]|uniref:type IV pili methyl-accepting chemotaxis transducer N-terminal domain-containing protein n=1 Tax=Massilia sp. Bi118 TaxID=2822346 RepID=UPI001DDE08E0|nr:type IV pili methyl-accepting chemotaxis transducer N-terminal domain-containing protein [Massilia sp. Bi118]CAH0180626.1 Nitrate/nitrite sensor protein NarX [Massilia sp. Bi118]
MSDTAAGATPAYPPIPGHLRLSTRIAGALVGFLLLALAAIGATLWLSWQLEGAGAAINETGSLRKQEYRLAMLLGREVHTPDAGFGGAALAQIASIDATLALVAQGDPQRPLGLPPTAAVRNSFAGASERWRREIRPLALRVLEARGEQRVLTLRRFLGVIDDYVDEIDGIVRLIESDNEVRTFWLRSSQLALMALGVGGTVALVYLMFSLIVRPVERLHAGMRSMADADFGVRLEADSKDEFGQLATGFNQMADRLERVYGSLEDKVREKTAALENQNRELALLYDSAAFLQARQTLEPMCEGFLERILQYFGADGGSVRLVEAGNEKVHLVAQQGLPEAMAEAERCMPLGDCLCGEAAVERQPVVHWLRAMPDAAGTPCARNGFGTVSVFQIFDQDQHLGVFTLHFRAERRFRDQEQALLDTLGRLLGTAIENLRLAAREREMAISEERNMVARGLHDSIAQGLNFLNLQVQMLDDSLRHGQQQEAADIVPALRAGVKESYEDVRELLQNFRSRLEEDDLNSALRKAVRKFRDQTGIDARFAAEGAGSLPFAREEQLQILFIVQEALSNIRKHAQADRVDVHVVDGQDFSLSISDNGVGFDSSAGSDESDRRVGLHIMQERAEHINAELVIESRPGAGTTIGLHVAREQRRAA